MYSINVSIAASVTVMEKTRVFNGSIYSVLWWFSSKHHSSTDSFKQKGSNSTVFFCFFFGFSEFGLVSRRAKEPHSFRMCYTSRTPLGILYAGSIRLGSALAKGWNECPGPGACFGRVDYTEGSGEFIQFPAYL